jgi:N-sulfoglucosamine sulfohydrolase
MKLKTFHPALLLLFFLALISCSSNKKREAKLESKPLNILIISSDDLNYNSIGAFGCKVEGITPNIDKLASEGIRFTHAYNNTAVCQPCRQSWLTGMYPHNNGAEGLEPINENIATLPGLLKKAGYINGILGKEIHHQPTENFFWDFIPFKTETDAVWRNGDSRNPALFHEYAKQFFELAKSENKPFFFSVNSHDPHRPFAASASDSATYGSNLPPVTRIFKPDEIEMLGYLPDIPDVRKEVAQYYNSVYRSDQSIGAVLNALKESGLEENTLVIYLSDHGAAFPFAKSQCYLNSTKAPMIIRWPGKTRPGTVDTSHLVSGIDLMPTILEAASFNIPENLDGSSFLPILEGDENYEGNSYVFTSYYQVFAKVRYPMRSIQNQDFGYIFNFWADGTRIMRGDATGGITWKAMVKAAESDPEIAKRVELFRHRVKEEFYDLKNDPDALKNLIDDPAYLDKIIEFRKRMLQAMKQYNDPAYEAYLNRNEEGRIKEFMDLQDEKAKKTKPNVRF